VAPEPVAAPRVALRRRLLLAEDNRANQKVAGLMLARLGYEVEVADNGRAAIELLGRSSFDAVLMDCQMPLMDGYSASRWIREGRVPGGNPRVPIIAVTAYARNEDRERCRQAGMDGYVSKPLRAAELEAELARCLRPVETEPAERGAARGEPRAAEAIVLDGRVVAALRELPGADGEGLFGELRADYLASEEGRLAEIAGALAQQDAERTALLVHALGGEAATLGGIELRSVALALEATVHTGNWDRVATELPGLIAACARFREALRADSLVLT
jgi:CheY-like chemotaxis protein